MRECKGGIVVDIYIVLRSWNGGVDCVFVVLVMM